MSTLVLVAVVVGSIVGTFGTLVAVISTGREQRAREQRRQRLEMTRRAREAHEPKPQRLFPETPAIASEPTTVDARHSRRGLHMRRGPLTHA